VVDRLIVSGPEGQVRQRDISISAISGPRPACDRNARNSDQRVDRNDHSLVHSEWIRRGSVTARRWCPHGPGGWGRGGAHLQVPHQPGRGVGRQGVGVLEIDESLVMLMKASSSETGQA